MRVANLPPIASVVLSIFVVAARADEQATAESPPQHSVELSLRLTTERGGRHLEILVTNVAHAPVEIISQGHAPPWSVCLWFKWKVDGEDAGYIENVAFIWRIRERRRIPPGKALRWGSIPLRSLRVHTEAGYQSAIQDNAKHTVTVLPSEQWKGREPWQEVKVKPGTLEISAAPAEPATAPATATPSQPPDLSVRQRLQRAIDTSRRLAAKGQPADKKAFHEFAPPGPQSEGAETPPVTSKATSADAEVRERRHVVAENDEFSLRLVTRSDRTFGPLEVYEKAGDKLACKIPASSQRILVDFGQERIVIMNKAFGPGQLDFDKLSPMRGAIVFSMAGEKKGVIPGDVYQARLYDGMLIGLLRSGGMVAYDIAQVKELWQNKEAKFAHEWGLIGPNLLYGRRHIPSRQGGGLEVYVVDTTTGKTMFRKAAKDTEHLRIVAAHERHFVMLKYVKGAWISEIQDWAGNTVGTIPWGREPVSVVLNDSGERILAVCCSKGGKDRVDYMLQSRTLQGKQLWQKKLLSTPLSVTQLNASIQREGKGFRVKLLEGDEVRANVTVEDTRLP